MTKEAKAIEIFNHYGVENQAAKMNEETGEFLEAFNAWYTRWSELSKQSFITSQEARELDILTDHVCEEFADMNVVFLQFQLAFKPSFGSGKVYKYESYKLDRQIKRMEEEKA